jgi:DUF1680 family protein
MLLCALFLSAASAASAPAPFATPFPLSSLALPTGSRFATLRARNAAQLLSMNLTDVLCEYTAAANLTGTWDAPTCRKLEGVLYWGHYTGHFLSALAMLVNATGNAAAAAASASAVATLASAQAAWGTVGGVYAGGYLFPFNYSTWDSLFKGVPCSPSCVPWYVFHKALQGMIDQHVLAGSAQALIVATGMAAWAKSAAEGVIASGGMGAWQNCLNIEWGGMNDALFQLFGVTADDRWRAAALLFEHYTWTVPLAAGGDPLPGQHANTHIPEVVGDATGYALTGNATKLAIAANFFSVLNSSHSYATGGSSDGEMWGPALRLGDALNDRTEESCTTYNALKLSRAAFLRDGSPLHLDHYERAFFNGLLGNMAVGGQFAPPTVGWIYMLPLGSSDDGAGLKKPWGASNSWLACCWGTLSETFAKIGDSVFFHGSDTLYVGLFASASVAAGGLTWAQASDWPYDPELSTTISVTGGAARNFTLAVRVPLWATARNTVTLNGAPFPGEVPPPGSWLTLTRVWAPGDALAVFYEPTLRFEPVADDRPEFAAVGAFMWGGTLLAAVNSTSTALPLTSTASPALAALVARLPSPPGTLLLSLRSDGEGGRCGAATLTPLADIQFEVYTVYHSTGGFGGRVLSPGAPAVPGAAPGDFSPVFGGAAVVPLGGSGALALRSGDAHARTSAELNTVLIGAGGVVTGVRFSYSYASGAFPRGGAAPANFSLVAVEFDPCSDTTGAVVATLYHSPPLAGFPFADCNFFSPQVPGGFLAAGEDVWSGSVTVAEAEAKCATLPACVAFTFASSEVAPAGPVNAYLKSAVDFVAAPG